MNPLRNEQKESIIRRLSFITQEMTDLKKYKDINITTYHDNRDIQRQIERCIEIIMNGVIDISKIILAGEDLKVPSTYRESIEQLRTIGVLEDEIVNKLVKYVELRNIIAHEYLDIRFSKIKDFLDSGIEVIEKFVIAVNRKL